MKRPEILYENYIQYLTIYEAINAIGKETYLIKCLSLKEAVKIVEILADSINFMNILSIHSYQTKILETAINLGLTVYNASYIVLAEKII